MTKQKDYNRIFKASDALNWMLWFQGELVSCVYNENYISVDKRLSSVHRRVPLHVVVIKSDKTCINEA